jgi:hypothetical protein
VPKIDLPDDSRHKESSTCSVAAMIARGRSARLKELAMKNPRWSIPLAALFCAWHAVAAAAAELLPPDKPVAEVIDHYVDLGLKEAGVEAAPQAAETNFIRRLTLDLAGRIPTVFEVKDYVASTDLDKRVQLVDRLLQSPQFVAHEVNEFDALLMYGSSGSLRDYLSKALAEHRPWDRMFRDLLAGAGGDGPEKGAEQFLLARAKDSNQLTNDVSTVFFGVNISCTQCHDHPLVSDWKQDHFYGMKSFFNRTFENGGFLAERDYGIVTYKTPKGEDRVGRLMFLSGTTLDEPEDKEPSNEEKKKESEQLKEWAKNKVPPPPPKFSRRARLLDVALQPGENQFFARSIVNRIWRRLFGYGLVMPVDQMHSENPASHPELLQWLARDLVENNFDLWRLVRGVVLSQAYSRSSRWEGADRPDPSLFAVANLRPLTPCQFAAALRLAASDPQSFAGGQKPDDLAGRIAGLVNGSRGLADLFDMPQDNFQVSVSESLLLSNGERISRELLATGGDRLLGRLKQLTDHREQVDTAVWAILSRPPSPEEARLLEDYLSQRADRADEALSQLVWALMSGAEFRFNY